jgi:hypothetical protein
MKERFEIAGGTVTGRDHVGRGNLLYGKNNQDAFSYRVMDDALVVVVCDGCSEGAHSEVGAHLGSQLVSASLIEQLAHCRRKLPGELSTDVMPEILERVRQRTLSQLRLLAQAMTAVDASFSSVVGEYFLFTVIGTMITPNETTIFSIGDGVFALNGAVTRLGPFPGNAPPYLAYPLVRSSIDEKLLRFQINACRPTEEIQSLLIGCDGVEDLVAAIHRDIPGGRHGAVGPISRFWEEDRYFKRDQIRRRLGLINSEVVRLDPETKQLQRDSGLLPDDTTFVVIRRRSGQQESGVD